MFSKVSLLQYKIPKVWSQGDLLVYDNNQYVLTPSIKIEFQRLFSGVRKQLIDRGMNLIGITDHTPGIILPMWISENLMGFLAIWGRWNQTQ